jgi:hypothetical protein
MNGAQHGFIPLRRLELAHDEILAAASLGAVAQSPTCAVDHRGALLGFSIWSMPFYWGE